MSLAVVKCYRFNKTVCTARLVSLFFSLLFLLGCDRTTKEVPEKVVPVKLVPVTYEKISRPINRSGILSAKSEAKLSFKVGGIIEHIWVDEGQTVRKRQPLASLVLDEMRAFAEQARSNLDKTRRDLDRVMRLWNDNVTTLTQKQDAETAFKLARANLEIAEFNLEHARILAPENGRILKRWASENEMVSAGMPIFLFSSNTGKWVVRVGVTDAELLTIHKDDSARITLDAYPTVQFSGVVSELAEAIDPNSATYEVEVELVSFPPKLISGFVARVKILPSATRSFYIIPIDALTEAEANQGFIFTLQSDGKRVKKIPVIIDHFNGQYAAISTDLKNISQAVSAGAAYLTDSTLVNVVSD